MKQKSDSNFARFLSGLSDEEKRAWFKKRGASLRKTIIANGGRHGGFGPGIPAWSKGRHVWVGKRKAYLRMPYMQEGYVVWNKGQQLSASHKTALSAAARRRAADPKWRARQSACMKGRPSPNKGKPMLSHVKIALNSPEACRKRGETRRRLFASGILLSGNIAGTGLSHYRSDLGRRFRSCWEANVARVLTRLGVPWSYEPDVLRRSDGSTYRPDFKVPRLPYIEVKGMTRKWLARNGPESDRSAIPGGKLYIIDGACYASIRAEWKPIIGSMWEGA